MKSLPDRFPIRYAIVISETKDIIKANNDFDLSKRGTLLYQLIDFLKKTPISLNDLSINYVSADCIDGNNNKICVLPKIKGDTEWQDKIYEQLKENIPMELFVKTKGTAFNLSLYSYKGMIERPLFWRVAYGLDKKSVIKELHLKNISKALLTRWGSLIDSNFKEMMKGGVDLWENLNSLKEPLVFYIKVPYSGLWKFLDKESSGGVISYNEKIKIKKEENLEDSKYITVAIARSLHSLVTEEMFSLYKMSKFCNNCAKPLPFSDSNIKYCPKTLENMDCYKKRMRIRKKKDRSQN